MSKLTSERLINIMRQKAGFVYLMLYTIDGTDYYKIGFSNKHPKNRITSINRNNNKKHNDHIINVSIINYFTTEYPLLVENYIKLIFSNNIAKLPNICDGRTELFHPSDEILDLFNGMCLFSETETAAIEW